MTNYEEPNFPFKQEALIRDYNALYLKIYDKVKYVDMWVYLQRYKLLWTLNKSGWRWECVGVALASCLWSQINVENSC